MKTYLIALGILVALGLWMLTGLVGHKTETNNKEALSPVNKQPTAVRVKNIEAESKQIAVILRGQTRAKRIVNISAQIAGVVISTPVEKGQHVKKGELLCELAEEDRKAQFDKTTANVKKAQLDYDGAKKLFDDGMISSSTLAASLATLENEKAMLKQAQLNLSYLQMRAPFDGFVEDRPAQQGALIERGHVCATLVDETILLTTSQASEKQVQQLSIDQPALVTLIDGQTVPAHVSFIGRSADAVTRTYTIETQLDGNGKTVRDGLTAEITVPLTTVKAHHISPAVFALDEHGTVSVRIVDKQNQVLMMPVTVVAEDIDGVWITGLPDKVQLIVVGQELVSAGEHVTVVAAAN